MIKKLLIGSISIFFTFTMFGCGIHDTKNNLEDKIVIGTTYSDEVIQLIDKTFNEETGIKIEYKKIQGDLQEYIENNTGIDFILGGDISDYKNLSKQGYLKSYKTSWFSEVNEPDRGENGEWYAISRDLILLIYNNNNLLPQNAPKAWSQLALPIYKNKIIIENTDNEYVRIMLASIMYQYYKNNEENKGIEYYQEFKNNISVILDDKESLFQALKNKETPVAISTLSDYMKYYNAEDNTVVISPEDGVVSITQGAAILNSTNNPNASELFMEFIAGPRMQLELAKNNNIIPIYPDIIQYGPEWMQKVNDLTLMDIDWNILQEKKNEWIDTFNSLEKQVEETVK